MEGYHVIKTFLSLLSKKQNLAPYESFTRSPQIRNFVAKEKFFFETLGFQSG